ncbi:hypothetical protein HDV62DRAFT_113047 [Trichoderma sp. SZMC 28011]
MHLLQIFFVSFHSLTTDLFRLFSLPYYRSFSSLFTPLLQKRRLCFTFQLRSLCVKKQTSRHFALSHEEAFDVQHHSISHTARVLIHATWSQCPFWAQSSFWIWGTIDCCESRLDLRENETSLDG